MQLAPHSDGMAQMTPTTHLDQLALHLMAGRYDLLAESYVFPLPVIVDDAEGEVASAAHIWPMYQSLHALLRAGGYDVLRPRLVSVELPANGRFRLWADWYGSRAGVEPVLLFRTQCENEGSHDDFRSVKVSFDTRPWPQLSEVLAA